MKRIRGSVTTGAACAAWFVAASAFAQSPPKAPPSVAVGDATLTPIVDLRAQGELRVEPPDMGGVDAASGVDLGRVRTAFAMLERSRLGVQVDSGAVRGRLTLEDARVWGTASNEGTFGPYEGFLEIHSASSRPAWVRIGRQSVVWGEGLLLGAADFAPVGRALDAIRLQIPVGPVEIEGLAVLLVAPGPSTPTFGRRTFGSFTSGSELFGARAAWPFDPWLKVELMTLARIARSSEAGSQFALARGDGELYTGALRVSGDGAGFSYGVEGAYQLGRVERRTPERRSAFAVYGHAGKTFETVPLVPSVEIGGSYASGGGEDGDGTYRAFDPILPDVHTHFGLMNAFAWSNTMAAHLRGKIVMFPGATAGLEARHVWLADSRGEWLNGNLSLVGMSATNESSDLGYELDARVAYEPWPILELSGGYAGTLWGDGARTILAAAQRGSPDPVTGLAAPSDFAHFAYLRARLRLP